MAAVTSAVVAGAATLGSAAMNSRAASKAASAQNRASESANAMQSQIYQNARGDLDPYLQAGSNALGGLNALAQGDYSGFESSPDYLYARGQAQQGIERGAAARGSLYSGGTNVDLANALSGIASQNLGNYRNSLMGLANMGASAGSAIAGLGQNYANAYGANLNNSANAQGANALAQGNNWGQAITGLAGLTNNYAQSRQSSYQPGSTSYFGNNLANFKGTW